MSAKDIVRQMLEAIDPDNPEGSLEAMPSPDEILSRLGFAYVAPHRGWRRKIKNGDASRSKPPRYIHVGQADEYDKGNQLDFIVTLEFYYEDAYNPTAFSFTCSVYELEAKVTEAIEKWQGKLEGVWGESVEEPDPEHYLDALLPIHAVPNGRDALFDCWRVYRTHDHQYVGDVQKELSTCKWAWTSLSNVRMRLPQELEEADYDSLEALLQAAAPHIIPPPQTQVEAEEPDIDPQHYVDELPPTFTGLMRENGFDEENRLRVRLHHSLVPKEHGYTSYWHIGLWGYRAEEDGSIVTKLSLELWGYQRFIVETFRVYTATEKDSVKAMAAIIPACKALLRPASAIHVYTLQEFIDALTALPEFHAAVQAVKKANIRASGGVAEALDGPDDPQEFIDRMPDTIAGTLRGYGLMQWKTEQHWFTKHYTFDAPLQAGATPQDADPTVFRELVWEVLVEQTPDKGFVLVFGIAGWGNLRSIIKQFAVGAKDEPEAVSKIISLVPVFEKFFAKLRHNNTHTFSTDWFSYENAIKHSPEFQALVTACRERGEVAEARVPKGQTYRVQVGKTYWFEYHCFESDRSSDAVLWYHSHQQAKVLNMEEAGGGGDENDRAENGQPAAFQVRFADGYTWTAMEDELFDSRENFNRPDPPLPPEQRPDKGKQIAYGKDHGPVGEAEELPLDDPESMVDRMMEPTRLNDVWELLNKNGYQPEFPELNGNQWVISCAGHPDAVKQFLVSGGVHGMKVYRGNTGYSLSNIIWPKGQAYFDKRYRYSNGQSFNLRVTEAAKVVEALADPAVKWERHQFTA